MSQYLKLVEYIRNFDISDLTKFTLEYNPVTKSHEITRWEYNEENGITRPTLSSLDPSDQFDLTYVEEEIAVNNFLLPKHHPRYTFHDPTVRLYSVFTTLSRVALDRERQVSLTHRSGNNLTSEIGASRTAETRGNIILKFSGFYIITLNGECFWPGDAAAPRAGSIKITSRRRQFPETDQPNRPPYSRVENVLYETSIAGTNKKFFSFNFLHNARRSDMLEIRASKTSGTTLSMTISVVVECLNVNSRQPYFRFSKTALQADQPQPDAASPAAPVETTGTRDASQT